MKCVVLNQAHVPAEGKSVCMCVRPQAIKNHSCEMKSE